MLSDKHQTDIMSCTREAPQSRGQSSCSPPNNPRKPLIVFVEGNIGAGKSTLIRYISKCMDVRVLEEPVNEWSDALQLYYADREKYATSFQATILMSRILQLFASILLREERKVVIMERSPLTGELFIQQLLKTSSAFGADAGEQSMLQHWFASMRKFLEDHFELATVYIRVGETECLRRVRERDRPGESELDTQLLKDLHAMHESRFSTHHVIEADNLTVSQVFEEFERIASHLFGC